MRERRPRTQLRAPVSNWMELPPSVCTTSSLVASFAAGRRAPSPATPIIRGKKRKQTHADYSVSFKRPACDLPIERCTLRVRRSSSLHPNRRCSYEGCASGRQEWMVERTTHLSFVDCVQKGFFLLPPMTMGKIPRRGKRH